MRLVGKLGIALVLAACGAREGGKTTDTTTAKATMQAAIVLEFGEMSVFQGGRAILRVHADGSTDYMSTDNKWMPGPRLKQDGIVEQDGSAVARVDKDGTIVDLKTNARLPVVVSEGTLTVTQGEREIAIHLAANGSLDVLGEPQENPVRVDGATTPGQRKTVLAFIALMLGARTGNPAAPAAAAPSAQPAG